MAKLDSHGNLITSQEALKQLYLDTYTQRLKHREMKEEFKEVFVLKTQLWNQRLENVKTNISSKWKMLDIENVIKKIKKNLTSDPNNMINELLLPGVMGLDLKLGLLSLVNGIKKEIYFPKFMQLANIFTIYKNKGSRMEMKNDRGIFILSVFRKFLDNLLYSDKYPFIDKSMSDSNIGARKDKNIKNHLFVVYGVINSALNEDKSCLDITVYDLVQCFDGLWLEDCMLDMFDALPPEERDDKLAVIYESNHNNYVAVNTPVGQTERVNIQDIVMQGGTFGSLMCSNSMDSIGKKCHNRGENLYLYKQMVRILPLSMVDDILGIAKCGQESLALNTFINAQIELKQLKFHTPDKTKKTKCHKIHVGSKKLAQSYKYMVQKWQMCLKTHTWETSSVVMASMVKQSRKGLAKEWELYLK